MGGNVDGAPIHSSFNFSNALSAEEYVVGAVSVRVSRAGDALGGHALDGFLWLWLLRLRLLSGWFR